MRANSGFVAAEWTSKSNRNAGYNTRVANVNSIMVSHSMKSSDDVTLRQVHDVSKFYLSKSFRSYEQLRER